MTNLPERVWKIVCCPICGSDLNRYPDQLHCRKCKKDYPVCNEQIDLRLPCCKSVALPIEVGKERPHPPLQPIPINPAANGKRTFVDEDGLSYGNGLTQAFYSWFPSLGPDATMLDLGCGFRRFEKVCEATGAEYIGLDIDGYSPHVLGRGEALPFKNESFDFVLSIATLPHTEHPSLTTKEVNRVLRPGCLFMGTSQFLEPCFMASRHHSSALGLIDWLDDGGFEILYLEPNQEWDAFLALAGMSYFPCTGIGRMLPLLRCTVTQLHRWLWRLRPPKERQIENQVYYGQGSPEAYTAGFRFIARKPVARGAAFVPRV